MEYMHANSNCLHVKSLKNDREGFVFDVSFFVESLFIAKINYKTSYAGSAAYKGRYCIEIHHYNSLIPQHKFMRELQVSEKQSSQNTWICQKFHLSWCCKHKK